MVFVGETIDDAIEEPAGVEVAAFVVVAAAADDVEVTSFVVVSAGSAGADEDSSAGAARTALQSLSTTSRVSN